MKKLLSMILIVSLVFGATTIALAGDQDQLRTHDCDKLQVQDPENCDHENCKNDCNNGDCIYDCPNEDCINNCDNENCNYYCDDCINNLELSLFALDDPADPVDPEDPEPSIYMVQNKYDYEIKYQYMYQKK